SGGRHALLFATGPRRGRPPSGRSRQHGSRAARPAPRWEPTGSRSPDRRVRTSDRTEKGSSAMAGRAGGGGAGGWGGGALGRGGRGVGAVGRRVGIGSGGGWGGGGEAARARATLVGVAAVLLVVRTALGVTARALPPLVGRAADGERVQLAAVSVVGTLLGAA